MSDDWGQVRLDGLAAIQGRLRALPAQLEKNAIMGGLRAAAQVIRVDAQARAPVLEEPTDTRKPGTVRDAITVRRSRQQKNAVYVGVRQLRGKQIKQFIAVQKAIGRRGSKLKSSSNPDDPFYWIFLEFGTEKMAAKPFLRPAFEAKKFEALRRFEEYMKTRVEKEAAKLARIAA